MSHLERVVVLVDMDCFYCQVEEKLNPDIKGKPIAVVQYNAWRGGGIIAVNYPARDQGVTRHMRGDEAQKKCPEIQLCRVPNIRGKADLTKYREAGKEVANVLHTFTPLMLRASIDEAYLDITDSVNQRISTLYQEIESTELPTTHVVGCDINDFIYNTYNDDIVNEANLKLIVGALIVEKIRTTVYEKTGYRCSAGIAHNKILAKLACGMHKPNKQTILPHENVKNLYETLSIKKITSLGGKFGDSLAEDLHITNMGELEKFTEKQLQQKYDDKTGTWLYNIARGIDTEPVTPRLCSKSIGCCKKFPGKNCLKTFVDVSHWLKELGEEISERLSQDIIENQRKAKHMVVSYTLNIDRKNITSSRSKNLSSYDAVKIAEDALDVLKKGNPLNEEVFRYPVTFLSISVGKFEDCKNTVDIKNFFLNSNKNRKTSTNQIEEDITDNTETNNDHIQTEHDENSAGTGDYDKTTNKLNEKSKSPVLTNNINTKSFFMRYLMNKNLLDVNSSSKSLSANESNAHNKEIQTNMQLQSKNNENPTEITNNNSDSLNTDINEEPNSPVIKPNLYEICKDCSRHIPLIEIESHQDFHVALKIAEEQRAEVRQDMTRTLKKVSPTKKTQTKNILKRKIPVTTCTLKSFLQKTEDSSSTTNTEMCSQCMRQIPVEKFTEHLDYHEAKKLHAEINYNDRTVVRDQGACVKSNKKRKKEISLEKSNKKNIKSIANFFKPI